MTNNQSYFSNNWSIILIQVIIENKIHTSSIHDFLTSFFDHFRTTQVFLNSKTKIRTRTEFYGCISDTIKVSVKLKMICKKIFRLWRLTIEFTKWLWNPTLQSPSQLMMHFYKSVHRKWRMLVNGFTCIVESVFKRNIKTKNGSQKVPSNIII